MEISTLWWIATGLVVAVEMLTGTFYMLMFALGLGAGAVSAQLGAGINMQIMVAAIIGGGAVAIWHFYRSKHTTDALASANRDVHLDIGERIQVQAWADDGTAQVRYRGANWTAVLRGHASNHGHSRHGNGMFQVVEMQGNRLIVEPFLG